MKVLVTICKKIVFGFLFGVGLCIPIYISESLRDEQRRLVYEERREDEDRRQGMIFNKEKENLKKILIHKTRMITNSHNVTFALEVENGLDERIRGLQLVIELFDDDGFFGKCEGFTEAIEARRKLNSVITCNDFYSRNFGENISHKISVKSVRGIGYGL